MCSSRDVVRFAIYKEVKDNKNKLSANEVLKDADKNMDIRREIFLSLDKRTIFGFVLNRIQYHDFKLNNEGKLSLTKTGIIAYNFFKGIVYGSRQKDYWLNHIKLYLA